MSQEQPNNRLKTFKFTKPEIFRTSLIEPTNDRQRLRPWHDKKSDLTDYFNHGFNEHTLQIYAQKVTKMCEKYNQTKRDKYITKLQNLPSGNLVEQLFSRSNLASRDQIPMDLGGLSFVVSRKLLKIQDPQSLMINEYSNGIMKNGQEILYSNNKINQLREKIESKIKIVFKKSVKKQQNLYLFEEVAKLLPQPTKSSSQFMNTFQFPGTLMPTNLNMNMLLPPFNGLSLPLTTLPMPNLGNFPIQQIKKQSSRSRSRQKKEKKKDKKH